MRRPGNLNNLGSWFGNQKIPVPQTKVLHPDIYEYNPRHIAPLMRQNNYKRAVKEVAEQIYTFDLFTPEFCKKLIEEAEASGGWETSVDNEKNPYLHGFAGMKLDPALFKSGKNENEKDTTLSFSEIPRKGSHKLAQAYLKTIKTHVTPLIENIWRSFHITKYDQPYLLKYEPDKVKKMNLHYDLETVALVIYLNTDYKGGGTYFPKWKLRLQPKKPGQAAMWPGGVSHEHIGLPITAGVRYLMCGAFY